jgi:hypothetical protein
MPWQRAPAEVQRFRSSNPITPGKLNNTGTRWANLDAECSDEDPCRSCISPSPAAQTRTVSAGEH